MRLAERLERVLGWLVVSAGLAWLLLVAVVYLGCAVGWRWRRPQLASSGIGGRMEAGGGAVAV